MIDSYVSARNEIFSQYNLAKTGLLALLTYQPIVVYQGVEPTSAVPTDKLWVRISQNTVLENQATLAGNDLKRRYTSEGLIYIQLFIPKTVGDYTKGVNAAVLIKNGYRGKQTSSCMWFRNVRIAELPPEDAWFRLNVVSEYQYDEIG
jgi:hypothetical protein